ncbi:MAG: cytochrome c [Candidatus Acidiferrales bacterium]
MLDNEKCTSASNSSSRSIGSSSFRRTVRLGTFAMAALALAILGVASSASANAADDAGAQAFKSNCVVCHGADGTGTATGKALKAPDLNSEVQKLTDAQITTQISDGKNNMPPFKSTLTKEQIQSLTAYIRATFGKKK